MAVFLHHSDWLSIPLPPLYHNFLHFLYSKTFLLFYFYPFFLNFSTSVTYNFISSSSLWSYSFTIPLGCPFHCLIIFCTYFIVKHFFCPFRTFIFYPSFLHYYLRVHFICLSYRLSTLSLSPAYLSFTLLQSM